MTQPRLLMALAAAALAAGCGLLMGPDDTEPLSIERFIATPERVDAGENVTLLWSVDGAEEVTIDHGIGEVEPRGSHRVKPGGTTSFTLTAKSGTTTATSTIMVVVAGSNPSPNPSPSASPSPSPSPSPSSSPSPSPSPSPGTIPSPSPSPSSGPSTSDCGTPARSPDSCALTLEHPVTFRDRQCVELTRLVVTPACPVANGGQRQVSFDVTARVSEALSWRRIAGGTDVVSPGSGGLTGNGTVRVNTSVQVQDDDLGFEVVDGSGRVLMRFALKHR